MYSLTYVTGNFGKYIAVKEKIDKTNILIDYFNYDLDEANINDIKFISKQKAKQAYDIVGSPVFVTDTGFYIKNYPNNSGFPGAFVKRSGISSNIDKLLKVMRDVEDRSCCFIDCLTFYDGCDYYQFFGVSKGSLAYEKSGLNIKKAKSNLWYVFIPDKCSKTLAQMSDEERKNKLDDSSSAITQFIEWYQNNYLNMKKLQKK